MQTQRIFVRSCNLLDMILYFFSQSFIVTVAIFLRKHYSSFNYLASYKIGHTCNGTLNNCRMRHHGTFHFKRSYAVT